MPLNPGVEFRTPEPPSTRYQSVVDWPTVVSTLKADPGEWGYVGVFSSGVAGHIKAGRYPQFHPHGDDLEKARVYMRRHWEVTVRKVKPKKGQEDGPLRYETYIRWLG